MIIIIVITIIKNNNISNFQFPTQYSKLKTLKDSISFNFPLFSQQPNKQATQRHTDSQVLFLFTDIVVIQETLSIECQAFNQRFFFFFSFLKLIILHNQLANASVEAEKKKEKKNKLTWIGFRL